MDDRGWDNLIRRVRRKKVTPFIGAGACYGTLPTGGEVARIWAERFGYPFPETESLTRVAQYLAVTNDPMWPKEHIIEQLEGLGPPDFTSPAETHGTLADLDLPVYLTTNYDDFMTKALEAQGKRPRREHCRWNHYLRQEDDVSVFDDPGFEPTVDDPVVFHLHGRLDESESLVLTEDDYLEFVVNISRHDDLLPARIQRSLTGASLLFVGYSLDDWTFKVIFKGLIGPMESSLRRDSVAIQLPPEARNADTYLTNYFKEKQVSVFWGDADSFMTELRQRLDADRSDGDLDDVDRPALARRAAVPRPLVAAMPRTPKPVAPKPVPPKPMTPEPSAAKPMTAEPSAATDDPASDAAPATGRQPDAGKADRADPDVQIDEARAAAANVADIANRAALAATEAASAATTAAEAAAVAAEAAHTAAAAAATDVGTAREASGDD